MLFNAQMDASCFVTGIPNDLAEKVLDVLGNMSDHCLRVATLPTVSGLSELIALYQQLGEQPVQF